MKIIRDIKRVNGELPSLEGHTKMCAYGENADGTDALICVCPPAEVVEVKEAKKVVAPKPKPAKKPESKVVETIAIDLDGDEVADLFIEGEVIEPTTEK